MFWFTNFLCLLVVWCSRTNSETTTVRYVYNSSDLSYLSNGIQFPVSVADMHQAVLGEIEHANTSIMHWMSDLYDHHTWTKRVWTLNNEKCREDMIVYIRELHNGTSWATKMFDASGRYAGHFFFGNDYWLGSLSLCSEIGNEEATSEFPPFETYFYVAKIRINVNRNLTPVTRQLNVGECLPKSCKVPDVRMMLAQERNQGTSLNIVGVRPVPGDYSLFSDIKVHIVGGVTLAVIIIIIVASLVDVILKYNKKKAKQEDLENENNNNNNNEEPSKNGKNCKEDFKKEKKNSGGIPLRLLLAFSAITNGGKILAVNTQGRESITCIHGLRVFSIAWIILVHTYLEVFALGDNKTMRVVTERSFMYQTISNATFSVDTFFFISGLLVTITYFRTDAKKERSTKKEKPILIFRVNCSKFILMVIYRFFRLTPAYLFVLGVNEIILRYLHSYSVFSPAIIDHISCSNFWWRNALYINNFYPQTEFCMLWSWYIANDTQFYVIAAVLLLIGVRGRTHLKFVGGIIGAFLVTSWITSFIIAMKFEYIARVEEPFALFDQLYDKPWLRIGPYLIGMVTGYFLFAINTKMSLPPSVIVVGWMVSLACLASLVYGLGREGLVVPASAFYAALGHTAWGLSLAWITIACCLGYGGPFNSLFSCRLFLPLSRLTYCAYLVHPVLMCLTSFILDGPLHLHNVFVVVIYFGNVVLSFATAFAISLAFEAPIVNLLKIIF